MRPIRASEISSFLYCNRAWWYQQKGTISNNIGELAEGTKLHQRHGRAVLAAGLIKTLGYGFLLIALVLFSVYVTNRVL